MNKIKVGSYVRVWFPGAITNYGWLIERGAKLMVDARVHGSGGVVDLKDVSKKDIEECPEYPNHGF